MTNTIENVIDDPMILYVLMRTDLPDYQPGKSMAQANHAGTKFMRDIATHDITTYRIAGSEYEEFFEGFNEWLAGGDGFGTCIVLGITRDQLLWRMSRLDIVYSNVICGLIHDPTYPIRDGNQVQTLPVDTCGYVFGRKSDCRFATDGLDLFKG